MVSFQPVTFPLHPVVQVGAELGVAERICACWKGRKCSRIGKHPTVEWKEVSIESPSPGRIPGGGVGLRTGALGKGSGIVVVDLDTRAAAAEFDRLGGLDGPTKTVITGRPGIQYYFAHPGFHVSNSVGSQGGIFPGIDIRGDGGFVVMPGSPHKSGRVYRTLDTSIEISIMPEWLKDWLWDNSSAPQETQVYDGDVTDEDELVRRRRMFIEHLETAPPSIQGEGGDQALFDVVQYGAWDLALPTDDVLELIAEYFDPRCEPPWDHELAERVIHKSNFAKTSSNRPRRVPVHVDEEKAWEEILAKPEAKAKAFDNFIAAVRESFAKNPSGTLVHPEYVQDMRFAPEPMGPDVVYASVKQHEEELDLMSDATPDAPLTEEEKGENAMRIFQAAGELTPADPFKMQWGGWSAAPPPEKWLVNQLLHDNKVSMIYADPGSIKTWLAISIALAISSSKPWLGNLQVDAGPVLYLDFEDGAHEFHRRKSLLSPGTDDPNLGFSYSPDTLSSQEFWRKLATVSITRGIKLIIIDTLAGGTAGMDENSTEAAMPMMYAGKITEGVPGVSVLFLHHANKSGGLRGSSAFTAAVDTLFKLEKETSSEGSVEYAKLTCVKSGQKKVPTIELRLSDSGGLERNVKTDVKNADEINLFAEVQDKRTFEDLRDEVSLLITQRGPVASVEALCHMANGAKKSTMHSVIRELSDSGRVVQMGDGWVSDSEALRKERLRAAIQSFPDAAKPRLLQLAYVDSAYFERMLALGHVRNRSSDRDIPGYIWRESV